MPPATCMSMQLRSDSDKCKESDDLYMTLRHRFQPKLPFTPSRRSSFWSKYYVASTCLPEPPEPTWLHAPRCIHSLCWTPTSALRPRAYTGYGLVSSSMRRKCAMCCSTFRPCRRDARQSMQGTGCKPSAVVRSQDSRGSASTTSGTLPSSAQMLPDVAILQVILLGGRAAGPEGSHQGKQPAGAAAWAANSKEVAGNAQVVGVSPSPRAPRRPRLDLGRDALQAEAGMPQLVLVLPS